MVEFTILYDNNPDVEGLRTGWGFASLIELPAGTLLFDTGGDGPALLANFEALGKDPRAVDVVVLSHAHGDHTGGLAALLESGAAPTVYVPAGLAVASSRRVEVDEPQELLPGVWTTGAVRGSVTEQALVVQSAEGWVLVTGCAHPGIVQMVERAQEAVGEEIHLVMGGFHLRAESAVRIEGLIEELQALGVEAAAPTHCSGDEARRLFKEAFGEQGYLIGVGTTFRLER
jgi:7,8-dihydropterin-6-yl-methyl-4-(beta-D-ribofuranosyl)aminobenzene 5'-phosphate synthase